MTETPPRDPVRAFLGYALIAVGGLMAALCGACTLVFFVGGLISSGGAGISVFALMIGALPTGLGVLLFFGGRAQLRVLRRPPPGDPLND